MRKSLFDPYQSQLNILDRVQDRSDSPQSVQMIKTMLRRKQDKSFNNSSHNTSHSVPELLNSDLIEMPYIANNEWQNQLHRPHNKHLTTIQHPTSQRLALTEQPNLKLKAADLKQDLRNVFQNAAHHYNSLPQLNNATNSSTMKPVIYNNNYGRQSLDGGDDMLPTLPTLSHILFDKETAPEKANKAIQHSIAEYQDFLHKTVHAQKV